MILCIVVWLMNDDACSNNLSQNFSSQFACLIRATIDLSQVQICSSVFCFCVF